MLGPRMKCVFIPAVTDYIPTMHVTGDDRRLPVQGPCIRRALGPQFQFTTDKQVVGVDLLGREFFFPFNSQMLRNQAPWPTNVEKKTPTRMLNHINVGIHASASRCKKVVTGLVLMRIGNEQIIQRRIAFDFPGFPEVVTISACRRGKGVFYSLPIQGHHGHHWRSFQGHCP
ncbi:MAG: hypothetical protein Ct9H90mP16_04830 [Candidatus Poseidoniales archaeon]|nr:MAG: hypothetical protein Ct9H90mP16_04830 [Candidatus Poseidoniales archaeon]